MTAAPAPGALAKITDPADRLLQKLFFDNGCYFELLPHQLIGARCVAGVPPKFPGVVASSVPQVLAECDRPRTPGILLADDMGLGKTVQASAPSLTCGMLPVVCMG